MSGRIRSIKPEWLEDERLAMASSDARVLSVALMLLADDYGNGRANHSMLAGQVFPALAKGRETLAKALEELARLSFVITYERDKQSYYSIRNWAKHQKVDKPGKARVPAPTPEEIEHSRVSRESSRESRESLATDRDRDRDRDPDQDPDREREGESEGEPPNGSPGKPAPRARAWRRFPPDYEPTAEHRKMAIELRLSIDEEMAKIRDCEFSKARTDPAATLRNWLRTEAEKKARLGGLPPGLQQHRANGGRGDEGPPPARPENRQLPDRKVERVAPGEGAALARSAITTVLSGKAPL